MLAAEVREAQPHIPLGRTHTHRYRERERVGGQFITMDTHIHRERERVTVNNKRKIQHIQHRC